MSTFIQNKGNQSLSKIINGMFQPHDKIKSMDFLVGYFYFSGLQEIYTNLQDKPLHILVGLDLDHDLLNRTSEFDFFAQKGTTSSNKEIREKYYQSLVNLCNQSDFFESEKAAETFRIYYSKIKDGTLEIRKTKLPNHAKMYVFTYKDEFAENGEMPGTVITGSSNFTHNGWCSNNEINLRLQDKEDVQTAQNIFAELWEEAAVLVDKDHIADFEQKVMQQVWIDQTPSPYLLYLRILYEYFHIDDKEYIQTPADITNGQFKTLKYQEDAVRMALRTIRIHNGVIIADVVGLGKSIIGSTVARNLNLRTIIIAPPHLVKQWEDYAIQFHIGARVFSRGNMDKVLQFYRQNRQYTGQWLIIIDEAHAYRNEYIRDYALLHEICQANKVMLLTATPFNNAPADIYAMIKLFQIPTRSTLKTVDNLGTEFSHLISIYKDMKARQKNKQSSEAEIQQETKNIGEQIRKMISPLVIRRSRLDLKHIPAYRKDLAQQHIDFPEVIPPQLLEYPLRGLESLYRDTLNRISPREGEQTSDSFFQAVRYQPLMYIRSGCEEDIYKLIEKAGYDRNLFMNSQRNLAAFMRTLLVHRFESSQYAFKRSLDNMLANCRNIRHWIDKRGAVPIFKKGYLPDVENLYESEDDTMSEIIAQTVESAIAHLESRGMFEVPVKFLREEFLTDLDNDISILETLQTQWKQVSDDNDPKLDEFIQLLKRQLKNDPERRIVVFSQFADTADYLGRKLQENGMPAFFYTSQQATPRNKEIIRANFDAGYPEENQKSDYKILVATDAISEGYNLHRAGTIFNYDIPYNPTRVIQRVGRINRINKKVFDKLYIYNYFPTAIGEAETRTKEITTLKMAMIQAIMGEDTRYLTSDEELNNYFEKQYKSAVAENEQESWDSAYRAFLDDVKDTEAMRKALQLPMRSKTRRLSTTLPNGILAFARKGSDYVFKLAEDAEHIESLAPKDALAMLQAEAEEKPYPLTSSFPLLFGELKKSLFIHDAESEKEKSRRDALDKVRAIQQTQATADKEYLSDLAKAIQYDALSGYALRQINKLKPSEFETIQEVVTPDYLQTVLNNYDTLSQGAELLIAAEEIQNLTINPQTELDL